MSCIPQAGDEGDQERGVEVVACLRLEIVRAYSPGRGAANIEEIALNICTIRYDKLLVTKGIATRSKDATNSWHYY